MIRPDVLYLSSFIFVFIIVSASLTIILSLSFSLALTANQFVLIFVQYTYISFVGYDEFFLYNYIYSSRQRGGQRDGTSLLHWPLTLSLC